MGECKRDFLVFSPEPGNLRQLHFGFSTPRRTPLYDASRMEGLHGFRERTVPTWKKMWAGVFFFAALLLPSFLFADVIYLKNGHKIRAQVTEEDEKQIFYEIGGGEFAVPKSLVDHVEKSPAPADPGQQATKPSRDVPLPITPPLDASDEKSAVIHDDTIDEAYLTHLTDDAVQNGTPENLHKLKQAYQAVAVFLTRKGDPEAAITRYREALKYLPHDSGLTLALGYLLWKQEHYLEAVDLLSPEADRYPQSTNLRVLLGSAYYGMENLDQAIAEWSKALAVEDNPQLRDAVARAQREREVSGAYSELRSEHFLLRYDGQKNERLSGEILSSLDGSFQDLVLDLDYSPTETIVVLLYPNQDFRDITRSPNWVGALNDGKIRIPVSGLTQMTPDLARVLKHELTHSFVRQITLGRCPTWLNEGLAQLEEGSTTAALGSQLARAMAAGKIPAFASLEGSFVSLPADQAVLAYAKSLAALEYLRDTFGMGEVRRLLRQLATADFSAVLQDEVRMTYPAFEDEVASYVLKKYGS
jgi:tetratricopeptide (TPR) repeat protein